jgi:hypothetical protein
MVLGVTKVNDVVFMRIQRADGNLMQQRLPDMGEIAVDQGDLRLPAPAQLAAQRGGQHEATGPAAHNHNVMQRVGRCHWPTCRRQRLRRRELPSDTPCRHPALLHRWRAHRTVP